MFLLSFSLVNLSIGQSGVLQSSTITMLVLFCGLTSNTNCFLKLVAHVFSPYTFRIVISCEWTIPYMSMSDFDFFISSD